MPINTLEEEENLEEGMCKRPKLLGSFAHGIGVPAKEEDKASGFPYGVANYVGCSAEEENLCRSVLNQAEVYPQESEVAECFYPSQGSAKCRLNKICSATGWKDPLYDFEEQGPPNNKLFSFKVTVYVSTITDTFLVCSSEPKREKKDAQEQAAQGALWYLKHFGHAS